MASDDYLASRGQLLSRALEDIERVIQSGPHSVSREWFTIDLNMPQIRVVFLLLQEEPLRMSDMAASLEVSMSRVTGLIDKLVERELVTRWTDQYDRRSVLCCLTEAGKELGGRLLAERRFRWEERLNHLNVSELKKFCQAMELVLNANRIPTDRNESRALESVSR